MKKRKLKKYLISYGVTIHHTAPHVYKEFTTNYVFINAYSKQEAYDIFYKKYPEQKIIAITDMSD